MDGWKSADGEAVVGPLLDAEGEKVGLTVVIIVIYLFIHNMLLLMLPPARILGCSCWYASG